MWWNKYIGRPFAEKGRGPDFFDCWGLLKYIYLADHPKQIVMPGYEQFYETTNDRDALRDVIFDETQKHWQEVTQTQEFDAIVLNMRGVPMHVGVVTKPGHMIHCARGIGTVHERFDSMRWEKKVLGFFRYE